MSRVVDIAGDTQVSVAVPYISDTYFKGCAGWNASTQERDLASIGGLTMTLVNPIASPVADQKIHCFTWISGGPDLQFNHFVGHRGTSYIDVDTGAIPTQSAVRSFPDNAVPIVEDVDGVELSAVVDSEAFDDYVSLGKRMFRAKAPFFNESTVYDQQPTLYPRSLPGQFVNTVIYLCAPFRWTRGSKRVRLIDREADAVRSWRVANDQALEYVEAGTIVNDSGLELPYYENVPFVRSLSKGSYPTGCFFERNSPPGAEVDFYGSYEALGDDFGFSGLYSPPLLRTTEPVIPPMALQRERSPPSPSIPEGDTSVI